ncbi:MarR family winged helix-turn-helix transcriptional regulator [Amycolatopsis sp. DSM 110486]|uniref:MarR family winged helix-turn-helix transcriptional regulator n=1 Tax=Amycolatopsis sp. DSM 110486 TaxID=2865832 RepID=UPI001C6959B2|nr:MarR family transcriptional regulator [Amycolatopsis sp. DSM 110486]QYN24006.1 MarR family transcriptional regulator [Amycolatopsis sp. DSM 110486]
MDRLAGDELEFWHAFKHAAESVRARVAEDIAAATGLSDPDFGVLTRLADHAGRLRQNQLAESMGWHRSRLSHHLTRMEQRGLVERQPADDGVEVLLTEFGRAEAERARPVHAAAVREHLLAPLDKDDVATVKAALDRLRTVKKPSD